jgi:hypothetical protein
MNYFRLIMNPPKPTKDKESPGANSSSQVTFVRLIKISFSLTLNKFYWFRLALNLQVKRSCVAVVSEPKWYVTSLFFRSNCNYKQEHLNELANVMNTHTSFSCFCCSNPNVEVEVKEKSDFISKSLPFSFCFRLFPLKIQHAFMNLY